jgi:hypothetical protein
MMGKDKKKKDYWVPIVQPLPVCPIFYYQFDFCDSVPSFWCRLMIDRSTCLARLSLSPSNLGVFRQSQAVKFGEGGCCILYVECIDRDSSSKISYDGGK